ncbi:hypothetical protein ACTQ47_13880 [Clostridium perfringens]|uniref:hypothetical protein n=1 Tax=Clostridium perfringens TaxID=1502 RepID=UPI003F906689
MLVKDFHTTFINDAVTREVLLKKLEVESIDCFQDLKNRRTGFMKDSTCENCSKNDDDIRGTIIVNLADEYWNDFVFYICEECGNVECYINVNDVND